MMKVDFSDRLVNGYQHMSADYKLEYLKIQKPIKQK